MPSFFREDGRYNWWVLIPTMAIVWALIIFYIYVLALDKVILPRERRDIQARNAFVADSLAHIVDSLLHDQHYIDSMRKADSLQEVHTMVIVADWCDSTKNLYHQSTGCWKLLDCDTLDILGTLEVDKYKVMSQYQAKSLGYIICTDCYHLIYVEEDE